MIKNDIKNFNKQFGFRPSVKNSENLKVFSNIVVGGMGGSHLSADLLKMLKPELNLTVHSDYLSRAESRDGLPAGVNRGETLFIASSYSGNTEETLDFAEEVIREKLPLAVIASGGPASTQGGKLLEIAKTYNLPYIILPAGIQPRLAIGHSFVALLTILGEEELLDRASKLEYVLNPDVLEKTGQELAEKLHDKISLIYSARENSALAYIWKIKLNETGKVPAFCNSLPELDHNEIVGFDNLGSLESFRNDFHVVFLKNGDEHPRVTKRIELTKKLLESRSVPVSIVDMVGDPTTPGLRGASQLEKTFNSIILADWTSFYIAKLNSVDPERVTIVEELKRDLV